MHKPDTRWTHHTRCALLIAGALGLAAPMAAAAQAPAGDAAQSVSDAASSDASEQRKPTDQQKTSSADDTTKLAAMVVTSQSRKQEVEDVPIAVKVLDSHQIEEHAATDISSMDMFVPGLKVSANQPTQPTYRLRGIGGSGFGVGTDSAVGVYIDGVYAARSGGALMAFNDVKRVEVLKGPQGTLFGRNSAAGAISVITNKPAFYKSASARVRVGNYGKRWGSFVVNMPVSNDMAFRVSAVDNQSDGWVRDAVTGKHYGKDDDWGGRLGWLYEPTANDQIWLTLEYERLNQPPRPAFGLVPLSDDTYERPPFPADPSTYLNPRDVPLRNDSIGGKEVRRFEAGTLHYSHNFGWGALDTITAYRHFTSANPGDFDGTNHIVSHLDNINEEANSSWYQEFKLSGDSDLANWLVGASWYHENAYQTSAIRLYTDSVDTMLLNLGIPTGTPDGTLYGFFSQALAANGVPFTLLGDTWREEISNHGKYSSWAVYSDVIWHLTDSINLTTGVRFTHDKKDFSWYSPERIAPELDQTLDQLAALGVFQAFGIDPAVFHQNLEFTTSVGVPVAASNSWTDVSPRVVLDKHFGDNLMGYVSVAKGYKAGGYNSLQVNAQFDPEKVWNYELGIKSRFPDQHLVLNASVYHYRYSGLQSLQLVTNTPSGVPRYLVNSSDQDANGAELEMQWRPLDGLVINASGAYIDSTFGHKITAEGVDLSSQPTGVPKLSYAVGVQYGVPLAYGRLVFNVNHAYRGDNRCNDASRLQGTCQVTPNFTVGGARNRTDARIAWNAPGDVFSVAGYVNNLFDHQYIATVNNVSTSVLGTPFAELTLPRMYGLEFRVMY